MTSSTAQPLSADTPLFIVLNSRSGSQDSDAVRATIKRVMTEAGRHFTLFEAADGSDLDRMTTAALEAARQHQGAVVAAGGDGTLNAVSNRVLGTGIAFGILPQGTFNYFGRSYGIPQDTELACRCLLDAVIEPVQVGLLNGKAFLVNASLGLYPTLLEDRETWKQRYGRGRLVAFWAALATLLRAHRQFKVQLETTGQLRHLRTQTIVVGNNALQLEHLGIHERGALQDNQLIAMTAKPMGTLALYALVLRGLLSRLGDAEQVSSFAFQRMRVRLGNRGRKVKVALDGEVSWMYSPLLFQVAEQRLPLLVPRDSNLRERA
ncbi:MAG: diacylglycerol kinase family protein [Pseudomonadaceae bacterium]